MPILSKSDMSIKVDREKSPAGKSHGGRTISGKSHGDKSGGYKSGADKSGADKSGGERTKSPKSKSRTRSPVTPRSLQTPEKVVGRSGNLKQHMEEEIRKELEVYKRRIELDEKKQQVKRVIAARSLIRQ